jgi:hypothetical protein
MGGGLMQLVAYGAQDIYITGNPQITFFKIVYRRHTNFAIEAIEQTFNGTIGFNKKVSATISRNGDLVTNLWLEIVLTKSAGVNTTYFPAEEFVTDVEFELGGQRIDKHYADWFRIYDELFRGNEDQVAYQRMTDFVDGEVSGQSKRMFFPLVFFFNKNPGLALPLIALQYHEAKLNFNFGTPLNINTSASNFDVKLYADYIYLDTDERRRFAQVNHEYLIEQLQFTSDEAITVDTVGRKTTNLRLNFNHPVKFLTWVAKASSVNGSGTGHGLYTGSSPNAGDAAGNTGTYAEQLAPLWSAKLQLNGHDRFSERKGSYFNRVQPHQTMGRMPQSGIYMYSFALKPEEHQPSGTCNFSRIDNATLQLTFKHAANAANTIVAVGTEDFTVNAAKALTVCKVFAVNYNVLRVMSGMGGLAYSN